MTRRPALQRVGVVVPVHDEEELLAGCLRSLRVAAMGCALPVDLAVVLDACGDGSLDVATAAGVRILSVEAGNVGVARRVGLDDMCERHGVAGLWLATTDADSTVPPDWLTGQLAAAAADMDAVVGTVQVGDWDGHAVATKDTYEAGYDDAAGHRHVHGANLGFSAAAYVAAGRMPPRALAEDVEFVAALEASGAAVARVGHLPVTTSARTKGRLSGGFADHLADLGSAAGHGLSVVAAPQRVMGSL